MFKIKFFIGNREATKDETRYIIGKFQTSLYNSCRDAETLGDATEEVRDVLYEFFYNGRLKD